MEPMTPANPPVPDSADEAALLCPGCGYDLRGSPEERCSECGLVFDRAALRVSAFPWASREEIGRFRAYWRTAWLILGGSRKLAWEAVKPQSLSDARRFRCITAALVATVPVGVELYVLALEGPVGLAFQPYELIGWAQDLAVPWSAGAANWFVMPMMLAALAFWMTDCRPLFWAGARPAHLKERVDAVAWYVSAAMLALPIAVVMILAACGAGLLAEAAGLRSVSMVGVAAVMVGTAAAIAVPGLIAVQWVRRVRHCGVLGGIVGVGRLLAWWLVGAVVLPGVLPWCAGFFWIVIDSFR